MYGIYTITKRKAEFIDGEWVAGEIVEVIDNIRNNFTPYLHQGLMYRSQDNGGNYAAQVIVAVSEAQYKGGLTCQPDQGTSDWIKGSIATDAVYTPAAGMDDAYWEIQTTIGVPGVERNIRTLCCTGLSTSYDSHAFSIVSLSSPCVQGAAEILQINYRYVIDLTTVVAESEIGYSAAANYLRYHLCPPANSILTVDLAYTQLGLYLLSYDTTAWNLGCIEAATSHVLSTSANSEIYITGDIDYADGTALSGPGQQGLKKYSTTAQFGKSNSPTSNDYQTGFPMKGIGLGGRYALTHVASINKGTTSSVQNTFGRSADDSSARPPFLDNNIIATSAASVNMVDVGEWANSRADGYNMPYIYRVTMEAGGLVGAATYKIRRKRLCRVHENSTRWFPLGMVVPTMDTWDNGASTGTTMSPGPIDVRHGQTTWTSAQQYDNLNSTLYGAKYLVQQYLYPELISWDYIGITITNTNGNWVNIDANSTPALTATGILQVSSNGNVIMIACEDTGLWRIDRDVNDYTNFTVTQMVPPGLSDATSCRGVQGHQPWGKGGITNIRVVNGGYNYAADETIVIAGANGTSATAKVAAVDADGTILSVTVTAAGSGYILDNLQAYVSTGSGVGASFELETGNVGDWWALFNDVTDTALYLAHATGITTDAADLTFVTGADTITRSGGASDFEAEGFRVGQKLYVTGSENSGENDGVLTINTVTTTVLTVDETLVSSTGADTTAQITSQDWEIMRETITTTESVTTANANPDTIAGTGTSFITQGFRAGMKIVISGSGGGSNDGIYTLRTVADALMTLDIGDALGAFTTESITIAALTDFTITNYTSGTPGRTGIIGLIHDPDHADDRFLMQTPNTKYENDGILAQLNGQGGFDWWSHTGSTGTVAAGTTDRFRVNSNQNNMSLAGEQVGTLCAAPLTLNDGWMTMDLDGEDSNYYVYGAGGSTAETDGVGAAARPLILQNKSAQNTVVGLGAINSNEVCVRKQTSEMVSGTFDAVLAYDWTTSVSADYSPNNQVAPFAYLGKGMFMAWTVNGSNAPGGSYVYTFNGTGLLADEDLMPYGFWDEFGWDGTRWVLGDAGAKTTHAGGVFVGSNLNFNAAGTIVGTFTGTDWAGDGFVAGGTVTIATADTAANNGTYKIESLSTTTLTVTPDHTLTTDATDTGGTAVGTTPLIDGLSLDFDDNAAADVFVIGEYYDVHLFDGILKDNATTATFDTYFHHDASGTGTLFSTNTGGSSTTTIPAGVVGSVTAEPWASVAHGTWGTGGAMYYWGEPGIVVTGSSAQSNLHMAEQNVGTGDFEFRFKVAGADATTQMHVGVLPWTNVSAGTVQSQSNLDHNVKIIYDKINFPLLDQYTLEIRDTYNGSVLHTENASRVMTIAAQTHADFDNSPTTEGVFNGGSGFANSPGVDDGATITLSDDTVITIDNVTATIVDQFTVTTASLTSSEAAAGTVLTQTSTTGSGTGFTLTLDTDNETPSTLGNDTFYINRTGAGAGNVSWGINGVDFYSHAGALNSDWGLAIYTASDLGTTMYDAEVDYTLSRYIMKIGNGTTTGAFDPNFRILPALLVGGDITFTIDGVAATVDTDGIITPPSAGNITLLPNSGRLWFHADDASKTIGGTWVYSKRVNIT